MDNKRAFSDYIAKRQAEHEKSEILKQKKLQAELDCFAADGREKARRSHYYRGRNRAAN